MAIVKNISDRRRAINTETGFVEFGPGEEKDVHVSDADLKANKDLFEGKASSSKKGEAPAADPVPKRIDHIPTPAEATADEYAEKSDDTLRDEIEDKTGKRPHHNTKRDKLIDAHREAFAA